MEEITKSLHLDNSHKKGTTEIMLPASKSIANRALMISALAGGTVNISNLSNARDTQTMSRLISKVDQEVWDVLDAGTTMRFLTAFAAVTNQEKIMTGTARMKERPIGILVEALRLLGADITYLENPGYPPLHIKQFKGQQVSSLNVRGDISSQYISALMMIGPMLPEGLSVHLQGTINSRPYIDMTIAVMSHYGGVIEWLDDRTINISPGGYTQKPYRIEPDWSAASYWYSMAAFAPDQRFLIRDLPWNSIQGDRKMAVIMEEMGVVSEFTDEGAWLSAGESKKEVSIDFADCPDIAQTIAVIASVKGITCHMTGLESLRIKETDRIAALQTELNKIGSRLVEHDLHHWELVPGPFEISLQPLRFSTYHDHRMAMAFAPLALVAPVEIENPSVVNKSYPHFWEDLQKAGIQVSEK
jgi:3-phosphoshikimate 1-carboxyvinyltransferase